MKGRLPDMRVTFVTIPDLSGRSRIEELPGNKANGIRFGTNGLAT